MNHSSVTEVDNTVSTEVPPDHSMVTREETDRALAALSKLSENQQEVIRLRIEHGLNYQQISEITDLSVSNVGYLLHVGLKSLGQSLS